MGKTKTMTAARLLVLLDGLGFTQRDFASYLDVHERTVRAWIAVRGGGRSYGPSPGVIQELEALDDYTDKCFNDVEEYVTRCLQRGEREPKVRVYRNDVEMHAEAPEFAGMPARWWRQLIYAAAVQLGAEPVYAGDIGAGEAVPTPPGVEILSELPPDTGGTGS